MLHRIALALLLLTSTLVAQETQRQYLSGKGIDDAVRWEFFCSAGRNSGQWTTLPVPSCWDAQGLGELAYGRRRTREEKDAPPPAEHGKYRHRFKIPSGWNGQTIFLVFDGSMTDTQASINGQSAGPAHQGAFYRFKYDVTKLLKHDGAENLLEVTVNKESADESVNRAERRGDYWNFGGIFRPVYLEARPPQHVDRVAIDARGDGTFSIDVFTAGVRSADTVRAQVIDRDGKPVGEAFSQPLGSRKTTLKTKIDSPRQWTAETPNLYHVEVTLAEGEKPLHRIRQRFGFRTIEVRAGQGIFVNAQRVLLKGTNRHTFWPESGRASSERLSRQDILLMKEMNNNAVRMSHYPPDEHFLDLCDELGLYVLDELAGWQAFYDEPTGRRLIGQMVTRDINHPSILFWDNGNEGGWNTAVDDEFAKWDPQERAVLHPWTSFRGIDTKHYPTYDLLVEKSKASDIFMPTEFQHALFDGGGGVALKEYWDVLRASKVGGGGFIWAFADETMKRKDQDGKMDGRGNLAPDGVLGPYRETEASFYAIKEIWSPIVITGDAASSGLSVENRYDFTNTDQCAFVWQLRRFHGPAEAQSGFDIVAEKKIDAPSIAPHARGNLRLDLPADAGDADALAVRVDDPTGRELWTWVWPLRKSIELPELGTPSPAATAKDQDDSVTVSAGGDLSVTFSKKTGRLIAVARGDEKFPLLNGPRMAIGGEKLRSLSHAADGQDYVISAVYDGDLKSVQWRVAPDGWVQLDYSYELAGNVDFLGVSFDLPEQDLKSMKWLGHGPFRVWKNRLEGGTLNVYENSLNDTQTGYTSWDYPEFKGYYAGVRWMQLQTTGGQILVALDDPSLFVQVLRPTFPGDPKPHSPTTAVTRSIKQGDHLSANAWANFPDAGFSILHGIAPMGTKFQIAQQLGPQSQQNVARGVYRGRARFFFGGKLE